MHRLNIVESCNHSCLVSILDIHILCIPGKNALSKGSHIDDVSVCGCMSQPKLTLKPLLADRKLVLEADSVQREKKESLAAVSVPRRSNCAMGPWSIESKLELYLFHHDDHQPNSSG